MSGDIKVNTKILRDYASKIDRVNRKLIKVDGRLKTLYFNVPVNELLSLIKVDALTGYSWRLTSCSGYLREVATNFEHVEKVLAECDNILDYQGLHAGLLEGTLKNTVNSVTRQIGLSVAGVKAIYENLSNDVKDALDKEWKEFNKELNKLKEYGQNISKVVSDKLEGAKEMLSNAWEDISDFCDKHPSLLALGEIGMDVVDLFSSVYGMNEPSDLVTGCWDLINIVPTVGCDLMALCVPAIGKLAGKDEKWIKEQSDNWRSIDSWAKYLAYEESGYESTDIKNASKLAKGFDKLDTINEGIKASVGINKTVKGADDIGKDLSDIFDARKGVDNNKKNELYTKLRKDVQKEIFTLKDPNDTEHLTENRLSNINTTIKTIKKTAEGKGNEAIPDLVKPVKKGREIGEFLVDVNEILLP